jgi:hypothetical protein
MTQTATASDTSVAATSSRGAGTPSSNYTWVVLLSLRSEHHRPGGLPAPGRHGDAPACLPLSLYSSHKAGSNQIGGGGCQHLSKAPWKALGQFDICSSSHMQNSTASEQPVATTSARPIGRPWRGFTSVTVQPLRVEHGQREGVQGAGEGELEVGDLRWSE